MKVAIVGAGVCGLAALKISLDYGFIVTCFEKTDGIGGLWNYKASSVAGQASVMKTTVINTSKEMMAFSDFAPSADLPNFMHWSNVLHYYNMYADNFNLRSKIKFDTEVKLVKRSADYEQTGKWDVTYVQKDKKEMCETFDGVMIANGHHAYPYFAKFDGMDQFKGRLIHSHDYKDDSGFHDRRILVVGIGNSGGDIAVDLGRIASQVYLSTRTGCWCISRVGGFGLPFDLIMQNRFFNWFLQNSAFVVNSILEFFINLRFDHNLFGLTCQKRVFGQHPFVNDDLPNRIMSGTVRIKSNIRRFFDDNCVEFDDGTIIEKIDDVIMCTGYDVTFDLLEKGVVEVNTQNEFQLYKLMYPPELGHNTMAVVGLIQPWGAVMPIAEMQARFHCEILQKHVHLPELATMKREIFDYRQRVKQRYGHSRRHTAQVDYITYMDDLARQFGAKPSIWRRALNEPRLALQLIFGPAAPYQFRLEGPHCWPGAKQALLSVWDRSLAQLKMGRRCDAEALKKRSTSADIVILAAFLILAFLVFSIFRIF